MQNRCCCIHSNITLKLLSRCKKERIKLPERLRLISIRENIIIYRTNPSEIELIQEKPYLLRKYRCIIFAMNYNVVCFQLPKNKNPRIRNKYYLNALP